MMTIVWAGLALGAVYAITAVVYNITIATSGIFNFAASQFIVIGAFSSYAVTTVLGLPWALSIPLGAVLGAVVGWLVELAAIRPLKDKAGWAPLVTTVGASVVIEGLVFAIYGGDPLKVVGPWGESSLVVLGGTLQPVDIILMVLAVVICIGAHLFHRRSRWGLRGRAITDDRDAAAVRGVNVRVMAWASFAIAGALGGAVGPIVAVKTFAVFNLGSSLVVFAFVALTLGGFGSYIGCLIGGLIVGFVQALSERYLGASFPLLVVFLLLLLTLLFRPTGLFGDRRIRLV